MTTNYEISHVCRSEDDIVNKIDFLKFLEGTKALGHLLIGGLALLSTEKLQFSFITSDEKTISVFIKITDLLRQKNYFQVNTFNHSDSYFFPLEPTAQLLELGNPDRETSIQLLFNISLQIPLVRAFELIKEYCKITKQTKVLKEQEWYFVAWAIRNCFSHDFNLKIYGKELEKLPYTWQEITITREMLGTTLKYSDTSIRSLTDLLKTMIEFATDLD